MPAATMASANGMQGGSLVAELEHVAEHGDAACAGWQTNTASAARIEAGLPL